MRPGEARKSSAGGMKDVPLQSAAQGRATGPLLVFILSDSIRGHLSQSRGIAGWLSRFTGADIVEVEAPRVTGKRRVELLKIKAILRICLDIYITPTNKTIRLFSFLMKSKIMKSTPSW